MDQPETLHSSQSTDGVGKSDQDSLGIEPGSDPRPDRETPPEIINRSIPDDDRIQTQGVREGGGGGHEEKEDQGGGAGEDKEKEDQGGGGRAHEEKEDQGGGGGEDQEKEDQGAGELEQENHPEDQPEVIREINHGSTDQLQELSTSPEPLEQERGEEHEPEPEPSHQQESQEQQVPAPDSQLERLSSSDSSKLIDPPHPVHPNIPTRDPHQQLNQPDGSQPPPPSDQNLTSHSPNPQPSTDQRWWIKQILWPPFPAQDRSQPRTVSILMQNLNGPCSLLAICNTLLLRGSITLPGPSTRTSISFGTLSTVLIDYLVHQQLEPDQLDSSLSIIPTTQTGLDLNPRFGSIDGFKRSSHPSAHGLDLFSAAGIPLVHGWIADSQDFETWDVVVGKCGDYDKALELVVTGEELIEKQTRSQEELTPTEQTLVKDALIVRKFLDSTSTQLSYPGLFQLASQLPPDSVATLLRNSHLSVIYRRPFLPTASPPSIHPPLPPPPNQVDPDYNHQTALEVYAVTQQLMAAEDPGVTDDPSLPKLFTLVTDLSFLTEPHIVWESMEDVEGGLSEFYDWRLRKSRLRNNNDRSDPSKPNHQPDQFQHTHSTPSHQNDNSDYNLAHQLQEEEYKRVAPHPGETPQPGPPQPIESIPPPVHHPRPISSSFRPSVNVPTYQNPNPTPTPTKRKKKDCIIV